MTLAALVAGAIISVLAFGGVQLYTFASVQIVIVLAALLEFWKRGFPHIGRVTQFLLATLVVVTVLQMLPLPGGMIAAVSPALSRLRETLGPAVEPVAFSSTLSINPDETKKALLRLVCYMLVFLLAFRAGRTWRGQGVLVQTLIGIGLFEAVYGLIQYTSGWQYIFTFKKVLYTSDATGTYINRNHFAGLLEMALPFSVGRILLRASRPGHNLRSLIISPLGSGLLLDGVIFLILGTALVFSRSRMGMLAAVGGILVVCGIVLLQGHKRMVLKIAVLVMAVPLAYSAWIGLGPVAERFERLGEPELVEWDRLVIWRDTMDLIRDYPLLGTGLGTYNWSSVHYQTGMFGYVYAHAHNDYLEFASEIGIPIAVLLFASLWFLVFRLAARTFTLERSQEKLAAVGGAGAMVAILIHSLADFNLQIPANAFLFVWICGTAYALVFSRSAGRHPRGRSAEGGVVLMKATTED